MRSGPGRTAALALVLAAGIGGLACESLFSQRSEGERIFRQRCARCHGIDASGNTPRYMGNARADLLDDNWYHADQGSMLVVIQRGIPGRMPGNPDLTREQLQALVQHIQALRAQSGGGTD